MDGAAVWGATGTRERGERARRSDRRRRGSVCERKQPVGRSRRHERRLDADRHARFGLDERHPESGDGWRCGQRRRDRAGADARAVASSRSATVLAPARLVRARRGRGMMRRLLAGGRAGDCGAKPMHLARRVTDARQHHRAQERDEERSGTEPSQGVEGGLSHDSTLCGLDASRKGDVGHDSRQRLPPAYSSRAQTTQIESNQWVGPLVWRRRTLSCSLDALSGGAVAPGGTQYLDVSCGGGATELVAVRVQRG